MRVGVDGARAAGAGNLVGADRDGMVRHTERRKIRCGRRPPREASAGVRTLACPDVSLSDVLFLDF
jgi:hypothetical protein